MIALTPTELATLHLMQTGEPLGKQDMVYLEVAATKIFANTRELRKSLGIAHYCGPRKTSAHHGDKLRLYLAEPKTHEEVRLFLNLKNRTSVTQAISQVRKRYGLCICLVSQHHWQHLPEYDGRDKTPTRFGHYLALEMLKHGRITCEVLHKKYGVPRTETRSVLDSARKLKKKFKHLVGGVDNTTL